MFAALDQIGPSGPYLRQGYLRNKGKIMGIVKNLGRWIASGGLVALLSACGPVIETHYDYLPPNQQGGMQCLSQCQQGQNQCRRSAQAEQSDCRYREDLRVRDENARAQENYEYEIDQYYREKNRADKARQRFYRVNGTYEGAPGLPEEPSKPYERSPSYYQCEDIGSQCIIHFNACYSSCGGRVTERQVCVENCD